MDVRLSGEQEALRDAAARLVDRLGPRTVEALEDVERRDKLDAALAAAGWRELRSTAETSGPWASAVETALVAEELARGLADTPFIGPTLAAELRRFAGAPTAAHSETVAFDATLAALAVDSPGAEAGWLAIDAAAGRTALLLREQDGELGIAGISIGLPVTAVDLTRPTATTAAGVAPLPGAAGAISALDLTRWYTLGLALTCADLVGVMRGATSLATEYASARHQYGVAVGSFQAVQHLLADALVATEGSRQHRTARRLGRRRARARRRARRVRECEGLLLSSRARGLRDGDPGARRYRQYVGVPRARLSPPRAGVDRHARRRRYEPRPRTRASGHRGDAWTSLIHRPNPNSAPDSGRG